LEHPQTRTCVTAERALLAALEAGCSAPIGALATTLGEEIVLEAVVGTETDSLLRHTLRGPDADDLGRRMADHFLSQLTPNGGRSPFQTPRSSTPWSVIT